MDRIKLVKPTIEHKNEIESFRNEMIEDGSDFAGCGGLKNCDSCEDYLKELEILGREQTCPSGYVASSSFLAIRTDGSLVGIIELRHRIDTPILSTWGGHIGFSVRPSERRRGYAKQMLGLLLLICRERGYDRVLITCNSKNIASERTIVANGGVFEKEINIYGDSIKRYWITL